MFVIDPKLLRVLYLRKITREKLAKVSDGEAFQLVTEATLQVKNEAGLGIVADLA
jgi:hypothetical protein